jgi:hypothetical protein
MRSRWGTTRTARFALAAAVATVAVFSIVVLAGMGYARTASSGQAQYVQYCQYFNHDVGIKKFSVPQSASAGQTRSISVGIGNTKCPDTVQVTLSKGLAGGGSQFIGSLTQFVPVRGGNRTTDFDFSYTFTSGDAALKKVTFLAAATIIGAVDAYPADNNATATTKVGK